MGKSPEAQHNKWSWIKQEVAAGVAAVALLASCSATATGEGPSNGIGEPPSIASTATELGRGTVPEPIQLDCRRAYMYHQRIILDGRLTSTKPNGDTKKFIQSGLVWSARDVEVYYKDNHGNQQTKHFWVGAVNDLQPDYPYETFYNAHEGTLTSESPTPNQFEGFGGLKHYLPNDEITGAPIIVLPDSQSTKVELYTTTDDFVVTAYCNTGISYDTARKIPAATYSVKYPIVQHGG